MAKLIVSLLFCLVFALVANGSSHKEKYRLQVHYSESSGWMNDPNGLIYHNGYYHLYYQHNPDAPEMVAEKIHWGHARSTDLVHWEEMPVAIDPYKLGSIFSGCMLIDDNNVTGLAKCDAPEPPFIALYTIQSDDTQSQGLAYSYNDGIRFSQYDGNPIIPNPELNDFRDPNVFKYNDIYYMSLVAGHRVHYYSSKNLIDWDKLPEETGVFPKQGDKSGVWECPSTFTVKDDQGNTHYVLLVSENGDARGALMQYFVGQFNETGFYSYPQSYEKILWAENAFDNYAAVSYPNDPKGRAVIIGWMNNWAYSADLPTSNWRGQMTVPREFALQTVNGELHLVQRPVEEFDSLIDASRNWTLSEPMTINGSQTVDLTSEIQFKTGSMLSLEYAFNIENMASGTVGLQFGNDAGEFVSFHFNSTNQTYVFDRRNSGNVTFNSRFVNEFSVTSVDRIANTKRLTGRIILDVASIEIFADNGLNTFTAIFFPSNLFENVNLLVNTDDSNSKVKVEKLQISALKSIWPTDSE